MGTQITVAIIGIVGVLIGLGASFFLQALQRRWALDDQRREWKRAKWEELSETYIGMAELVSRVYMMGQATPEDKIEQRDYISKGLLSLSPYYDSKLQDLHEKFLGAVIDFFECADKEQGEDERLEKLFDDVVDYGREFQERINELIEKTYQ